MEYINCEIKAGATEPFEIIHVSDIHLTYAEAGDSEEIRALSEKRSQIYRHGENVLNCVMKIIDGKETPVFVTGDMMDFVSDANTKRVREFAEKSKCVFLAGNHDFRPLGGMGYDVYDSLYANFNRVQSLFDNNIMFSTRVINGVKIVCMFNAYYLFDEETFDALKKETEENIPIILMLHVPLFKREIYDRVLQKPNRFHASLISVPEELMKNYPENRYIQQKENDITHRAYEYIKECDTIKAVCSGHLHFNGEYAFENGKMQYLTGIDTIRTIKVV